MREVRPVSRRFGMPSLRAVGLVAGPLSFAVLQAGPAIPGMPGEAQSVAAVATWVAVWWLTEAIPLPATALLPVVLLPLAGTLSVNQVAAHYGNSVIFLFLGGFMLSIAVQKWGLHRRIALFILRRTGSSPPRLVLGFMLATGLLSMWLSNSATAIMMIPIAIAAVSQLSPPVRPMQDAPGEDDPGIAPALMLGIAYAASIGGLATIIGSPPNAIFVGYARQAMGEDIGFLRWMLFGLPVAAVCGTVAYQYLTRFAFRRALSAVPAEPPALPADWPAAPGAAERRVLVVFGLVVCGWLTRGLLEAPLAAAGVTGVSDAGIAIAGALLLFVVPASGRGGPRLLEWDDLASLPWGILVLFGGGLALAAGIAESGLAMWLAGHTDRLAGLPPLAVLAAVALAVIFLTEITSNTATASVFIPIVAAVAVAASLHPYLMMMAVTVAASCAFMLPVATPPNAVVFASGQVTIGQMARAGFALNLLLAPLLALAVLLWLPLVWRF